VKKQKEKKTIRMKPKQKKTGKRETDMPPDIFHIEFTTHPKTKGNPRYTANVTTAIDHNTTQHTGTQAQIKRALVKRLVANLHAHYAEQRPRYKGVPPALVAEMVRKWHFHKIRIVERDEKGHRQSDTPVWKWKEELHAIAGQRFENEVLKSVKYSK